MWPDVITQKPKVKIGLSLITQQPDVGGLCNYALPYLI